MRPTRRPFALLAFAAFALVAIFHIGKAAAHATTSGGQNRYYKTECNYDTHWPHPSVIPIYLNMSPTDGVQRLLKGTYGPNWTVPEVEGQLRWAIGEFNDVLGTDIRLRYAGTTWATLINGGIVVMSTTTSDEGLADASFSRDCQGTITAARIRARVDVSWGLYKAGGTEDIATLFTHELFHALGIKHSTEAGIVDSNGNAYAPLSVMLNSAPLYCRHYTRYDHDTIELLYGQRVGTIRQVTSLPSQGLGASWSSSNALAATAARGPLGRLSEQSSWTAFGWVGGAGGTYIATGYQYFGGTMNYGTQPGVVTFSPPAVVRDVTGGEMRLFYLERDQDTFVLGAWRSYFENRRRVCWVASTDQGASWQWGDCLTDPSTGEFLRSWGDTVNAAFDPVRKVYVVTWLDWDDAGSPEPQHAFMFDMIRVMTIPGWGSMQTAPVQSVVPDRSSDTPAIACATTGSGNCLMVYVTRDSGVGTNPWTTTRRGSIDAAGAWTTASVAVSTQTQVQAPTISYQPWDAKFVLAYLASDMHTIKTRKKALADASWSAESTGASSTNIVSAPALGNDQLCFFGCADPRVVLQYTDYLQ